MSRDSVGRMGWSENLMVYSKREHIKVTEDYVGVQDSNEDNPFGTPSKYFRVGPDELSDENALTAIKEAAYQMKTLALKSRHALLEMGFADIHSFCVMLDKTVATYSHYEEAARRQLLPQVEDTKEL